ncbi:uncharacterized protein BO96DRAFT_420453 [Aspergillus niger CBS 101883]|uniref:Contig An04c0170, genomic contig n=2 Tax=Aspergillus niger TaxID=5061 RepID=A2QIY8_ASPNC|nr:uncharacterized protein BO96DRAFT_420453 [Aspergillus niger CBS 101883]XP_059600582.1 uncharacterized protein An04g05200 [Aspergillus niger]PYH59376.1 hypothetical protein BO96DRAFT_420453 [Aspergillus niger CBS 101883]CAK38782.1 unnamed protein product [Aspergillus niger]
MNGAAPLQLNPTNHLGIFCGRISKLPTSLVIDDHDLSVERDYTNAKYSLLSLFSSHFWDGLVDLISGGGATSSPTACVDLVALTMVVAMGSLAKARFISQLTNEECAISCSSPAMHSLQLPTMTPPDQGWGSAEVGSSRPEHDETGHHETIRPPSQK